MKKIKKIFALMIAMVIVLGMSTSVFAAKISIESGSSTSDATAETTTYTYYQILNASILSAGTVNKDTGELTTAGTVAYTIPAANTTLATNLNALRVNGIDLFTVTLSADSTEYTVVLNKKSETESFTGTEIATALNVPTITDNALSRGTFSQSAPGAIATQDNLNAGYYLITSSLGNVLAVQTLDDVTIVEKNDYPSVTKTVADEDVTAQIGDTINYTLDVTVPASATKEIVLTDTMTVGLTFNAVNSVTPYQGSTAGTALDSTTPGQIYSVSAVTKDPTTGNQTFTITFPKETVIAYAGQKLVVDYTATLNKSAVVGSSAVANDGNDNTVKLDYDSRYTTVPVTVETDTQKFTYDKVDGTDKTKKLSGAKFKLYKATLTTTNDVTTAVTKGEAIQLVEVTKGSEYRVATAEEIADESITTVTEMETNGKTITVNGIAGDEDYALVETQAPTGYNMLTAPYPIDPNTTNSLAVAVENNSGSTLPSTGGIGTTIFYVIGAILVIGAGVVLVTRRRMNVQK